MAKSFNSYLQTWCQHCLPWCIKEEKQNPTFSLSIKFYSFLSFLSFGSFWFPPLTLQADPRGPVFAGAQRCVTGGNSKRGGWALSLYFHMIRICSKKSVEMSDSHPWIHLIKQSQIRFPFFGVVFLPSSSLKCGYQKFWYKACTVRKMDHSWSYSQSSCIFSLMWIYFEYFYF